LLLQDGGATSVDRVLDPGLTPERHSTLCLYIVTYNFEPGTLNPVIGTGNPKITLPPDGDPYIDPDTLCKRPDFAPDWRNR